MGQARRVWSAKAVLAVVAAFPWRSLALVHPTGAGAAFVAVSPTTGATAATSRGCRAFGDQRRCCHLRSALWMSANDITPANGLTTSSCTIQRGRRGGSPSPESELFDALLASVRRMLLCFGACLLLFFLLKFLFCFYFRFRSCSCSFFFIFSFSRCCSCCSCSCSCCRDIGVV